MLVCGKGYQFEYICNLLYEILYYVEYYIKRNVILSEDIYCHAFSN